MTRTEFMSRLKKGLVGMPTSAAAEVLNDYEAHFDDGLAEGRSEAEVAEALGNPDRLARELKAEAGIRRWHQEQNPSSATAAILAVLGLGAIDILFLLPLLMSLIGVILGGYAAALGLFGGGLGVMLAGPFASPPGGAVAALLAGLGLMAASVTVAAILTVLSIWLVNGVVWFARLHYRLLKPALEPQAS
ncbi:DUF1700 domain-containing protein [Brevundimonas sp.]|uniref:DUF1700 domain-containing protein n=1 Tax=Brevundimonas sp. TaxID=1871086 RepID=UPI003AF9DA9A